MTQSKATLHYLRLSSFPVTTGDERFDVERLILAIRHYRERNDFKEGDRLFLSFPAEAIPIVQKVAGHFYDVDFIPEDIVEQLSEQLLGLALMHEDPQRPIGSVVIDPEATEWEKIVTSFEEFHIAAEHYSKFDFMTSWRRDILRFTNEHPSLNN